MGNLLTVAVYAAGICCAELAYWLPLQRRADFWRRVLQTALGALPLAVAVCWANSGSAAVPGMLAVYSICFAWMTFSTKVCTKLNWAASAYCGIWIMLTAESIYEIWRLLLWGTAGVVEGPALYTTQVQLSRLGFTLLCCAPIRYTVGRFMPENGSYHIGPRQLGSGLLLGAMFAFQYFALMNALRTGENPYEFVVPALLTQLYCMTLLYLQTELFKKGALEKEMDALNLLYERQRTQYQIARQNVQIINRKCHELKVQIADLRRLHPDETMAQSLDEAEQAARMYDANAATGNEVLDVVLTEKSLLCESRQIRLNSVADGTCLRALEPGDLYALFSNMLDQAIDAATQQQDTERRMIDLLVCKRQGFAVINSISPAAPKAGHGYELKVARRVVHKYGGTMTEEVRGELFAVKIVLPLGQQT